MSCPIYGIGYEPLGDVADFFDPLGIRKIPSAIGKKIDHYVDQKAGQAAALAERRVEAGVRRAVGDAGRTALTFVAGGVIVGAIVGGVWFYKRRSDSHR